MSIDAAQRPAAGSAPRGHWRVWPQARSLAWVFLALAAMALCAPLVLRPGPVANSGGWALLLRFLGASLHPALDAASLELAGRAALRTAEYALCGSVLSLLIGAPLGVLSAEMFWRNVIARQPGKLWLRGVPWWGVRLVAAVPRAVHEVVWGLLLVAVLGLTPMSAVLALGVPFGLITARVFADILDDTPREQMQALRDAGASAMLAFIYGLVPQALPQLLAYALYRLECGLRSAVILGLVGAGGLGFEIHLSLQSLRYEEVWLFLYTLAALVAAVDLWSSAFNRHLHLTVQAGCVRAQPGSTPRLRTGRVLGASLAGLLALVFLSFSDVELREALTRAAAPETWARAAELARAAWPPRLGTPQALELSWLALETLRMSVVAMSIAAVGGWLLSFPASAALTLSPIGGTTPRRLAMAVLLATRGALTLARSLSEGIWALVLLFVMFPGELPGALALGFYNAAVLGRLMAHVHDTADQRPLQALCVQGASWPCAVAYALVPAGLVRCAGYVLYRWEVCTRATAVVGIMGAGGLGRRLEAQLGSFNYAGLSATLAFYVGLTLCVDAFSAWARRALRQSQVQ